MNPSPVSDKNPGSRMKSAARRLRNAGRAVDWNQTFACLRYPNFRLWFWGQMISLFGSWMQITAQAFLLYQLTRSPVYLGLLGFANGVPTWLFMLYAGAVADRVPRRRLGAGPRRSGHVVFVRAVAVCHVGLARKET